MPGRISDPRSRHNGYLTVVAVGCLPPADGHTSLLSHRPGLVVVRGSRANVRDHQSHTRRRRTHSLLRRGLPLRTLQALQAVTSSRAKGVVGLGVRRRPPAGRAERRHRPEPHPYQGSAPGLVSQDRTDDLGERCTAGDVANRSAPMACGPTWTKAWLASRLPVPSGRRMPPALWSWRPGSGSAGRYSKAGHLANGTTRALTRVAEKVALTRSRWLLRLATLEKVIDLASEKGEP